MHCLKKCYFSEGDLNTGQNQKPSPFEPIALCDMNFQKIKTKSVSEEPEKHGKAGISLSGST